MPLKIVNGHGDGLRRNSSDGIRAIRKVKTNQTIVLPNLRDGLTHEEAAIATGMI